MHTWCKEIDLKQYNPRNDIEIHYFKRRMNRYDAHIIIVFWKKEEDLAESWEYIDSFIALNIQSKIELLIERSNFYICHFVSTVVQKKIKREIEQDPFCAKKYIYDGIQVGLQEACDYIEKRIFYLELTKEEYEEDKLYVKKIRLKNFRGYEGCVEVDLSDRNNSPALFNVIYAPNGVGKTSLFDGVEYALKGEVTYLKEIQKISKFKGPVYHNKKYFKEEAYADLILSDGSEISRKVSKVKENGTDLGIRVADSGKDLVGLSDAKTKWDCIILPHAKIDNFISAKKPDERYEEWFQSAPELREERNKFEKINREVADGRRKIEDTHKEICELEKKKKRLESTSESFKTVQKLIEKFNKSSVININTNLSTEYDYNELLNDIQKTKRQYENKLNRMSEEVLLIESFENEGLKNCKERFYNNEMMLHQIQQLKRNIEKKEKLLEIQRKYLNEEKIYKGVLEKIAPYNSIVEIGKDRLIIEAQKCKKVDDEVDCLSNYLKNVQETLEKLHKEIFCIEKEIQKNNNLLKIKEEALNRADKLDKLKSIKKEEEKELEKNKRDIVNCDEKILKYKNKIEELQLKSIPRQIQDWNSAVIMELGSFLKKELFEKVDDLNREYQDVERRILFENQNSTKVEKILLAIKENGIKYQELHKENCECPLCHSKFKSCDDLYKEITDNVYDFQGYKKSLENLLKIREDINKKYNSIYSVLESLFIEEINKKSDGLRKVVEEKNLIQKKVLGIEQKLDDINEQINVENEWFKTNDILSTVEKQSMVEYYSSIQQRTFSLQLQLKEKIGDIDKYKNICQEMHEKIESCRKEKQKITDNQLEYLLISFLLEINMEFDTNHKNLLQEKEEISKNMRELKEELEQYSDIRHLNNKQLEKELSQKENLYHKEEKFIQNFAPYKNCTNEDIERTKRENYSEVDKIKKLLEILQQIYEENNVRLYFTEYKQIKSTISKRNQKVKELTLEQEKRRVELEKVREDLEDKLSMYFSKSIMNDIYRKIDPHDIMKCLEYHLSFNDSQKGELFITLLKEDDNENEVSDYRPEIYFSTAQLNTVAFSSFFSRALEKGKDLPLKTIFIDDPIGHFDDMNVLGFADLMRSLIESSKCQIVMSTHDEKVLRILQRKLSDEYYSSCFLTLPNGKGISWREQK